MDIKQLEDPKCIFDGKRQQVLAISGGGYRGLFSATVLEELEKTSKKNI